MITNLSHTTPQQAEARRRAHRFPKPEHLTLQRDIEALFSAGSHSAVAYPVRAVWRESEPYTKGPHVKVLISVSKRKFKHAVDRNRAKRQMREAYRLNKHILDAANSVTDNTLHIGFIWIADTPQDTKLVKKRIITLLNRISDHQCSSKCS